MTHDLRVCVLAGVGATYRDLLDKHR